MRQTGTEMESALEVLRLAVMYFSFLHLHEQFLKMLMRFVDLACEIGKIGMPVDFGTGDRPMARIAAHIQEIHPTFFEFREHQMAHLVRRQLGDLKSIADPVKNIFDGPFREGLARVTVRVRQKNATICLGSVGSGKGCAVLLKVLFEAHPGRMREHDRPPASCSWRLLLGRSWYASASRCHPHAAAQFLLGAVLHRGRAALSPDLLSRVW